MVSRWRDRHDQALLIVDQFEELFTLNPHEVQAKYAEMLRRLADDADVHVLLAMRDDFLHRSHAFEPLLPIFEDLSALEQPNASALHRALKLPARILDFEFEDEELASEMVARVEGEKSALPLLAFAMSRLWELRDRERRLLTREAYEAIGGVGGALGQQAEATLKGIGDDCVPVVREIFRNLVTGEGTRAVREIGELLSVFPKPQRANSEVILSRLVDARLLTTFEEEGIEGDGRRRVEVVHESLLTSWPRLVRWQTQDAEGAQLRDELRQAAQAWDEHGRHDDRLWTGTAFREFCVWRERYPGGLSGTEEDFAAAMTSLATRRRRQRRISAAVVTAFLVAVAAVLGSLWRQSVRETLRAEAAKLLALAQVQLDTDPSEALAFATSSLELADTEEARIFAVRALSEGPPVRILVMGDSGPAGSFKVPVFSPDGRWVALGGFNNEYVLVWQESGGPPVVLGGHAVFADGVTGVGWTRDGLLVTGHYKEERVRIWEMPTGRLVRTIEFSKPAWWRLGNTHVLALLRETFDQGDSSPWGLRQWEIPDGPAEDMGSVDFRALGASNLVFDPDGDAFFYARGDEVFRRSLPVRANVPDTFMVRHSAAGITFGRPAPGWFFSRDRGGEIILWASENGTTEPVRRLREPINAETALTPHAGGRWAIDPDGNIGSREGKRLLWDLEALPGARPIELRRSGSWMMVIAGFHPTGDWVASATDGGAEISFWPLRIAIPNVVDGYETFWRVPVGFTPDGRYLVSNWGQDRVRMWPLPGIGESDVIDLKLPHGGTAVRGRFAVSPSGDRILSAGKGRNTFVLSRRGEEPVQLSGFAGHDVILGGAFSPSGDLVAVAILWPENQPALRVWDLESGEAMVFDVPDGRRDDAAEGSFQTYQVENVAFANESTLYSSGGAGLIRWNLEDGSFEQIIDPAPDSCLFMIVSADRRKILTFEAAETSARRRTLLHDLSAGEEKEVEIPTDSLVLSLGPEGTTWVAGDENGLVWVGRFDEGKAHVLAGHNGSVKAVAISPDRRWIASSGEDRTLRLWPMPDLSKPPLHTLPLDELIAKLKTLTNLRVVRDEESPSGWKLTHDPFPGWETVPEW
jgi:WD40 repeat protein